MRPVRHRRYSPTVARSFLWNPFIENYITKLTGHQAPVAQLIFNDADYQLISLSLDSVAC
jgi:hypothetical protein